MDRELAPIDFVKSTSWFDKVIKELKWIHFHIFLAKFISAFDNKGAGRKRRRGDGIMHQRQFYKTCFYDYRHKKSSKKSGWSMRISRRGE